MGGFFFPQINFEKSLPKDKFLSHDENVICEGNITVQECTAALNKMKKNKSPGLDGISTEFYQTFWPLFGKLLVDVFNESYEQGSLSQTQRASVISLIFKKGNTDDISNYRPISLTNVDYRILAFTLAERIQNVIGRLVSSDQSAYIRGRYMGTNIRLVSDIINHCNKNHKTGLIFNLDFTKAFDSIEWNFLYKTLQHFNFGESFIKWIKLLYHEPQASVKNNGYISDCFKMTRGIRQGCPVSALLFILCVEILSIKIKSSINSSRI